MILVTGSDGLIGQKLTAKLHAAGLATRRFDLKQSPQEDVCEPDAIEPALAGVTGVVHLAAVSRVVWAQNDPDLCHRTNVLAIENLVRACLAKRQIPWLISASSREVYGQADGFPVHEDARQQPMNVYARSKVRGEEIVQAARDEGMVANICRFSNVYGSADDHADRVVNAFARAAAFGGIIRVEGRRNIFDFTFVDEVADGLFALVQATARGERMPPIHFVSGTPTSLQDLAEIALDQCRAAVAAKETAPRDFDVSSFVGDPQRAKALLGWRAQTSIERGFEALIGRHLEVEAHPLRVATAP